MQIAPEVEIPPLSPLASTASPKTESQREEELTPLDLHVHTPLTLEEQWALFFDPQPVYLSPRIGGAQDGKSIDDCSSGSESEKLGEHQDPHDSSECLAQPVVASEWEEKGHISMEDISAREEPVTVEKGDTEQAVQENQGNVVGNICGTNTLIGRTRRVSVLRQ